MGAENDNVVASIAHVVVCAVAGRGISNYSNTGFTHPGMHANLFLHGILGFFHYNSGLLGNDFKAAYVISLKAVRYLPLACLNADLRKEDKTVSAAHVISGLLPFALSLAGEDHIPLGNLAIAVNIISLAHYSHTSSYNREWGWYTAGAAVVAYYLSPQTGQKFLFPLALAIMEYCAYRVFLVHSSGPPEPGRRRQPRPNN